MHTPESATGHSGVSTGLCTGDGSEHSQRESWMVLCAMTESAMYAPNTGLADENSVGMPVMRLSDTTNPRSCSAGGIAGSGALAPRSPDLPSLIAPPEMSRKVLFETKISEALWDLASEGIKKSANKKATRTKLTNGWNVLEGDSVIATVEAFRECKKGSGKPEFVLKMKKTKEGFALQEFLLQELRPIVSDYLVIKRDSAGASSFAAPLAGSQRLERRAFESDGAETHECVGKEAWDCLGSASGTAVPDMSVFAAVKPFAVREERPGPTEIVCWKCNKTGHKGARCPEEREWQPRCFSCGEAGHIARNCRKKKYCKW